MLIFQNYNFSRILAYSVFHTWFIKEFTTFVVWLVAFFSQFSGQLTVTNFFWSCCANSNCFRRDFVLHVNPTDFFEIFFAFFNALGCVNCFLSLKKFEIWNLKNWPHKLQKTKNLYVTKFCTLFTTEFVELY